MSCIYPKRILFSQTLTSLNQRVLLNLKLPMPCIQKNPPQSLSLISFLTKRILSHLKSLNVVYLPLETIVVEYYLSQTLNVVYLKGILHNLQISFFPYLLPCVGLISSLQILPNNPHAHVM